VSSTPLAVSLLASRHSLSYPVNLLTPLFPATSKTSQKSKIGVSITPFFSTHPPHHFHIFLTLKKISPLSPTTSENSGGWGIPAPKFFDSRPHTALIPNRASPFRQRLRDLCDSSLRVLCDKHFLRFHSFALSSQESLKSALLTLVFPTKLLHSSSLFVTLKKISPVFATLSKSTPGYAPLLSQLLNHYMKSAVRPLMWQILVRSFPRLMTYNLKLTTASPQVAANSHRCHNLPTPPARIPHLYPLLGAVGSFWGFYGIA